MNDSHDLKRAIAAGLTLPEAIDRITAVFPDIAQKQSWGETSFFYNPRNQLPRGTYFCTLKDHDGPHDKASHLDRTGIYRMNFGLPVNTFEALFGPRPVRPAKGGIIEGLWDFTALDTLAPHPVYGWMGWVAIPNPSETRFEEIKPLIRQAYERARSNFQKRSSHRIS